MKLNLLLFGITKELIGQSNLTYELPEAATVPQLMARLKQDYPALKDLDAMLVAVNNEYSQEDQVLHEHDEIALIPPVSGG